MQQHDIPELTPDEELDRTRVLPDPVDPLEGSARLPELRPDDEPGPEDEPEVPQEPKRRGRVVRKIVKYFLFLVLAVAIVAAGGIGYLTVTEYRPAYAEDAQRGNVLREGKLTGGQTVRVLTLNTGYGGLDAGEDFFMDGGRQTVRCRDRAAEYARHRGPHPRCGRRLRDAAGGRHGFEAQLRL